MIIAMLRFLSKLAATVAVALWSIAVSMIQSSRIVTAVLKQALVVLWGSGKAATPEAVEMFGRTANLVVTPSVEVLAESFGRALSRLVSLIGAAVIGVFVSAGYEARSCEGAFECTGGLSLGEISVLVVVLLVIGLVFAYAEVILADRLPDVRASGESCEPVTLTSTNCRCGGYSLGDSAVNAARLDEVLAQLAHIQVELGTPWWKKVLRRAR